MPLLFNALSPWFRPDIGNQHIDGQKYLLNELIKDAITSGKHYFPNVFAQFSAFESFMTQLWNLFSTSDNYHIKALTKGKMSSLRLSFRDLAVLSPHSLVECNLWHTFSDGQCAGLNNELVMTMNQVWSSCFCLVPPKLFQASKRHFLNSNGIWKINVS